MAMNPVPPVPDTWYAAHLLFRARVVDKPTVFPVVEKVVLLKSASDLAATTEAEGLGPVHENTRSLPQGAAQLEFLGVRKVTRMSAPSHGQVATELVMEVEAEDDLPALLEHGPVRPMFEW